jgi:hypothetical protein
MPRVRMNPHRWVCQSVDTPSLNVFAADNILGAWLSADVAAQAQAQAQPDASVESDTSSENTSCAHQPMPSVNEDEMFLSDVESIPQPGDPADAGVSFVTHEVEQPFTARLLTEWMPLAQEEVLTILSVTEDSVVLCVPSYSEQTGVLSFASSVHGRCHVHVSASQCPASFLTIQRMFLLEGSTFISVCSNPGCDRVEADTQLFQREAKEPYRGDGYWSVFANASPLCRCARAALLVLFGAEDIDMYSLDDQSALAHFEEWFDAEHMWSTLL